MKSFKTEYNTLNAKSVKFDKKYVVSSTQVDLNQLNDVQTEHNEIIERYNSLLNSAPTMLDRACIHNNMAVQLEGMRKYLGKCYDMSSSGEEKANFLRQMTILNDECISRIKITLDLYDKEDDKNYANDYLKEYIEISRQLKAATEQVDVQPSVHESTNGKIEIPPTLTRKISENTDGGIKALMNLGNSALFFPPKPNCQELTYKANQALGSLLSAVSESSDGSLLNAEELQQLVKAKNLLDNMQKRKRSATEAKLDEIHDSQHPSSSR